MPLWERAERSAPRSHTSKTKEGLRRVDRICFPDRREAIHGGFGRNFHVRTLRKTNWAIHGGASRYLAVSIANLDSGRTIRGRAGEGGVWFPFCRHGLGDRGRGRRIWLSR